MLARRRHFGLGAQAAAWGAMALRSRAGFGRIPVPAASRFFGKRKRFGKKAFGRKMGHRGRGGSATAFRTRPTVRKFNGSMPDKAMIKFRTTFMLSLTNTTGNPTFMRIAWNNILDPFIQTNGPQGRGFDQWAAFYDSYVISAAKIGIVIYNQSGTEPYRCCLIASAQTLTNADFATHRENEFPKTVTKFLEPNIKTFLGYYATMKSLTGYGPKLDDDAVVVATNAAPSSFMNFYLYIRRMDGDESAGASPVHASLNLVQYATFLNRGFIAASTE